MASLTLNDGSVAHLSISELIEYNAICQAKADKVAKVAIEKIAAKVETVKVTTVKATPSGKVETLTCKSCNSDFDHAITRGRKPSKCDACKVKSTKATETSENSADAPTKATKTRKASTGKREFNQESFDKWLAAHADEEMSAKWESRIRWMITDGYVMSDANRTKLLAMLDRSPRLTVMQAHTLRNKIRDGFKKA